MLNKVLTLQNMFNFFQVEGKRHCKTVSYMKSTRFLQVASWREIGNFDSDFLLAKGHPVDYSLPLLGVHEFRPGPGALWWIPAGEEKLGEDNEQTVGGTGLVPRLESYEGTPGADLSFNRASFYFFIIDKLVYALQPST